MALIQLLEKHFGEKLSESAKNEITTLVEAMVKEIADKKLEEAKAVLVSESKEEAAQFKQEFMETLDDYFAKCFDEWFTENKAGYSDELKVKGYDRVMENLIGTINANHIVIKPENIDPIKDLEAKLSEANDKLTESVAKINDLQNNAIQTEKQMLEFRKAIQFTKLSEGMTESDIERLMKLTEDIEAKDIETFVSKVKIIKNKLVESEDKEGLGESLKKDEDPDKVITESEDDKSPIAKYLPKGFY